MEEQIETGGTNNGDLLLVVGNNRLANWQLHQALPTGEE